MQTPSPMRKGPTPLPRTIAPSRPPQLHGLDIEIPHDEQECSVPAGCSDGCDVCIEAVNLCTPLVIQTLAWKRRQVDARDVEDSRSCVAPHPQALGRAHTPLHADDGDSFPVPDDCAAVNAHATERTGGTEAKPQVSGLDEQRRGGELWDLEERKARTLFPRKRAAHLAHQRRQLAGAHHVSRPLAVGAPHPAPRARLLIARDRQPHPLSHGEDGLEVGPRPGQ